MLKHHFFSTIYLFKCIDHQFPNDSGWFTIKFSFLKRNITDQNNKTESKNKKRVPCPKAWKNRLYGSVTNFRKRELIFPKCRNCNRVSTDDIF